MQTRDSKTGHSGCTNSRSTNGNASSCWVAAGTASLSAEEKEKLIPVHASVRLSVYLLDLQLTQCIDARLFTFWNVLKMFGGKPLVRVDIVKHWFYKCYICACMLD